ncbi:MAG: InlB B-repeat-containing protein [Clostridia bacterium]|nr:InlB B-repeat-containing protein [Clostridia bacterium]
MKRAFRKLSVLLLTVALLAGTLPVLSTSLSVVAVSENETTIYHYLKNEMGLNTAAACGVLANIEKESDFNPHKLGDNGTSYGICQWHNSRWDDLKTYCNNNGYDWTTVSGQLRFLKYELAASYPKVNSYLQSVADTASGAYDAAYYWCYYFEVPADKANVSVVRGNLAKNTYWPRYMGDVTPPYTAAKIEGGSYYLCNRQTGQYLVISDSVDAQDQNALQYLFTGETGMQLEILPESDTAHRIRPLCSLSRVLSVHGEAASGANVDIESNTGSASQRWGFEPVSGGYVMHSIQNGNLVLDILDTYAGANVQLGAYASGKSSQIWQIQNAVTYDANGGSGAPDMQMKIYGEALTLSAVTPTRDGYVFAGWSTNSAAIDAAYAAGGTYTANENAALYAVWKKSSVSMALISSYAGVNDETGAVAQLVGGQVDVEVNKAWNPSTDACFGATFAPQASFAVADDAYIQVGITSTVPFRMTILDRSDAGDKWILFGYEFFDVFGLSVRDEDQWLPAGSYTVACPLSGYYRWNHSGVATGNVTGVYVEGKTNGAIAVNYLQLVTGYGANVYSGPAAPVIRTVTTTTTTVTMPQPLSIGDIDGDGEVNMSDAFLLFRAVSGQTELTDEQTAYADINQDGVINIADAYALYRRVSGTA